MLRMVADIALSVDLTPEHFLDWSRSSSPLLLLWWFTPQFLT